MINSLISAGTGILSNILSKETVSDAMNQSKRNSKELTRYSASLQDSYNRSLIRDSSLLSKQGLTMAGYSPAFVDGASTPTQSVSPASSSPVQASTGIMEGLTAQQNMLTQDSIKAQNELARAEADKARTEAERQKIENEYLPQLLQGQLDLNGVNILFTQSNEKLNESKARELASHASLLDKQCEESQSHIDSLRQQIENMKVEERIKKIEEAFKEKEIIAQIQALASQANLSYTEALDIVRTQTDRIANIKSGTEAQTAQRRYYNNSASNVFWNTEQQKWNLSLDKKFGSAQRVVGMAGEVVGAATSVVGMACGAKYLVGAFKAMPKIGFR